MKKIILLATALFAGCLIANAQYAKSTNVVDGPIKYKFGNFYDASGQVIKGQENVISYIGSDNYFNIYQKAHKRYMTGAIVSAVGVGLFVTGVINREKFVDDVPVGFGLRLWSYPTMIVGGIMLSKNSGKLKQLAKEYNYNQKASLSFGPTNSGVGFAYTF